MGALDRSLRCAATILVSTLVACSAATDDDTSDGAEAVSEAPLYLALGDSLAFGEDPSAPAFAPATHFIGYPDLIAEQSHYSLTNAGCSGEASGGFIDPEGGDNGCRSNKAGGRLHVRYSSTQLAFAVSYLKTHPDTKLVTLDLGANDLALVQTDCKDDLLCLTTELPRALFAYSDHLKTIFSRLRGEAGYQGDIVALTTPSTDFTSVVITDAFRAVNAIFVSTAKDNGAIVADTYQAIADAAATANGDLCAAGVLIRMPNGKCDVHPNARGRQIVATAALKALAAAKNER